MNDIWKEKKARATMKRRVGGGGRGGSVFVGGVSVNELRFEFGFWFDAAWDVVLHLLQTCESDVERQAALSFYHVITEFKELGRAGDETWLRGRRELEGTQLLERQDLAKEDR